MSTLHTSCTILHKIHSWCLGRKTTCQLRFVLKNRNFRKEQWTCTWFSQTLLLREQHNWHLLWRTSARCNCENQRKKRKARMRKMIGPAVYATRKNMFHQALFVLSCDAAANAPGFSKWVEKEWKSVHVNLSAGVLLVASSQKQQKTDWRRAYTWPCCGNPSKSFRQNIRLFSQTWHTCLSLWSGLRRSNDGVLAWRLRLQVQRYVNPSCMKCCKGIT